MCVMADLFLAGIKFCEQEKKYPERVYKTDLKETRVNVSRLTQKADIRIKTGIFQTSTT